MIDVTRHGDVTRLRFWTMASAAAGYDVSAYLVRGVLIDTGFPRVRGDVMRALTALAPDGIIVTHWHEDHAGNAPILAEAFPIWMAPYTTQKLLEREQVKLYRHVTWGRTLPLVEPARPFDPGPLQVIPTPGHSADHHVVFDPRTETAFSADLWLGVKVRVVGASEDPYEIIRSLDRVIALRPTRMFDAHRGLVDNPVRALEAKRDWLAETVAAIEHRLAAGDDVAHVVRAVLGGEERIAFFSQGEYSRANLVRAVLRRVASHS